MTTVKKSGFFVHISDGEYQEEVYFIKKTFAENEAEKYEQEIKTKPFYQT